MLEKTDYSIFSELKKHYSIKGLNIIKCFLENYIKLINVQIKKIKKQEDAINDFIRPLDNNNDYNKLHYQNKPRINLNENNEYKLFEDNFIYEVNNKDKKNSNDIYEIVKAQNNEIYDKLLVIEDLIKNDGKQSKENLGKNTEEENKTNFGFSKIV